MGEQVKLGALESFTVDPENKNAEENETSGRKRKLPPWMAISTKDKTNETKLDDSGETSSSKRNKSDKLEAHQYESDSCTTLSIKQEPETPDSTSSKRNKSDEHEAHQDESESGTTLPIKQEPEISDSNETNKQEENDVTRTNNPVVKVEPIANNEPTASTNPVNNGNDPPIAVKVETADNASSAERPSCRFGIRCYRANLIHRREEAHPGDSDYRRPEYPKPAEGTPDCPFGSTCYRRNPAHFRDFAHPPDTNAQVNYRNNQIQQQRRLRQHNNQNNNRQNDPFDSDSELDLPLDPFFDDDDGSDYIPSDVEDEGVETDLEAEE